MFEIKKAFSKSPSGGDLMVIDEERDVWLQRISGLGPRPGDCFKLVWKGQEIPFEVTPDPQKDENGNEFIVKRLFPFGSSIKAEMRAGIKPWGETDETKWREAMLLAVEALLVFGSLYNGYEKPDGYHRVEFENRFYIKSDFGLP